MTVKKADGIAMPKSNPNPLRLPDRGWFVVTVTMAFGEDRVVYKGRDPKMAEKKAREYLGADAQRVAITDLTTGSLYWESRRPRSRP